MKTALKIATTAAALLLGSQAMAQVTFYEGEGFRGRTVTANGRIYDLTRSGFNDRASSVIVDKGRWEACEDANFGGRCVLLRRGNYDSLRSLGLDDRISSVRPASDRRYDNQPEPVAGPAYEYRRRPNEAVYQAPVTSVRAVVGPPNERCWMERQQVAQQPQQRANVGGAIIGGILGGVLGHQVGGGSGKDIATAGGAVGGAVLGSQVGRMGSGPAYQDVRRCENTASTTPEYWDVTYNYRGVEHRIQTKTSPGSTIAVNGRGEPRM